MNSDKQCMAVVGLQWGDEGKAKLVDYFADEAAAVVRWNGGPNAGHTVYVGDQKFILHQVPCGAFRNKVLIIGPECYVDMPKLKEEIAMLSEHGFEVDVYVDYCATVISEANKIADQSQKDSGIRTTGCGVGPAASCRAERVASRVIDHRYMDYHLHVVDTVAMLHGLIKDGKKILFEGAQSIDLDNIHGQYPYVSQRCMTGNILTSFGMLPELRDMHVLGVAKAYVTRSGAGPMVSEMNEYEDQSLRGVVDEIGATTGRTRRVGWIDIPQLRKTSKLAGCNSLAITKIDILSKLKESKMCTKYMRSLITMLKPPIHYDGLDPWNSWFKRIIYEINGDFSVIRKGQCGKWLKTIEDALGLDVSVVSFGPGRDDIIFL